MLDLLLLLLLLLLDRYYSSIPCLLIRGYRDVPHRMMCGKASAWTSFARAQQMHGLAPETYSSDLGKTVIYILEDR